jgi:hypothetical protein
VVAQLPMAAAVAVPAQLGNLLHYLPYPKTRAMINTPIKVFLVLIIQIFASKVWD